MKLKTVLLSGLFAAGCLTASAQDASKTEYVFNPHWYVQGQIGGQYTLGEIGFGKLVSPNLQVGAGYNFNSVFGLRLAVNTWQSKGGWKLSGETYKWKYNYVAPAITGHVDLTNLIGGFKPTRLVSVGVFAGIGANIAFNNDEAAEANAAILKAAPNDFRDGDALRYLWADTKTRLLGQFGANVDFRLTDNWSLGIELQANTLNDHYNSKKAGNSDWYFNGLVGFKYRFGKTYTKRKVVVAQAEPQNVKNAAETVVEKIVEVPVVKEVVKKEPLRRDVFFTIRSTDVTIAEMQKVREVAEYLKANPEAKVSVTGYADKGTGNSKINDRYASSRAEAVVNALVKNYGISRDRITSESKGDTEQPYSEDILNRVAICVAE
jgi:outer membrane protein OmpA-like peptidoglycan-associated protein